MAHWGGESLHYTRTLLLLHLEEARRVLVVGAAMGYDSSWRCEDVYAQDSSSAG